MSRRATNPPSSRRLVSVFHREEDLVAAVHELVAEELGIREIYTPHAVHGLGDAAGMPRSRLGLVCAVAAAVGSTLFFIFQDWASAYSWPLNVGGKPFSSLPAWIPVVFEAGVLSAGLTTVLALFVVSRLYPGKRPQLVHPRVTDDRYVVVQDVPDAGFDAAAAQRICRRHGAEVEERFVPTAPRAGERPARRQPEVWR